MAETTEGVVIQNEINVKTDKAVKNVDTLHKNLMKVEETLKDVAKDGNKVSEIFKALQKVKFNARGGGSIKDLQAGFEGVSTSLGEINRYFKALELSLTKQVSLLNRVAVSAQKANIQYGNYASATANINKAKYNQAKTDFFFGTPTGLAYQDMELSKAKKKAVRKLRDYQDPERARKIRIAEGIEKWREKQEILNQTLGVTQLRLMANYAAIGAVTSGFKAVLNYTVQYDKELRQLQAISAVSDTGLQNLKTTIEEVANSTKFSSLEIAQASTVLAQAGLSVSQIKDTLPSIANLATGTGTDLATATDVITSTLNIYELQVTEATRVTNSLTTAMNESKADISGFQTAIQYAGNFAAQLGMTYEETAAAIAAATQAGIRSKSMLGTGLRAVLTEFLKPTDKLIAQLESVGLTVDDINVKTKGFNNVLKTLKEAGFGAEEAFRGMERRGAAFLAALINQTDYMDQLRMSMAGSTAAAEANEIQMKSLSAQWDNFKSIMNTMGATGLEPVTKGLSKLLSVINKFLGTEEGKGANIVGRILFGGVTLTASLASAGMLVSALAKIATGLATVGKGAMAMQAVERFIVTKNLTGITANWVRFYKALKLIIALPLAKWLAAFTVLSTLYEGAKALGLFTSEIDKLKAALEESRGESVKASEEYKASSNMLEKLYSNLHRLNDESERSIFATEIVSRFPEAREWVDLTNTSIQNLIDSMYKLNDIRLDKLVEELKKTEDISGLSLEVISKDAISNVLGSKNLSLYGGLKELKDLTGISFADFSGYLRKYDKSRLSIGGPSKQGVVDNFSIALINRLENTLNRNGASLDQQLFTARSWQAGLSKDNFLKPVLDAFIKSLEDRVALEKVEIEQGLKNVFGEDIKSKVSESVGFMGLVADLEKEGLAVYNKGLDINLEANKTLKEDLTNIQSSIMDRLDKMERLRDAESVKDLVNILGLSEKTIKDQLGALRKVSGLENKSEKDLVQMFVKEYESQIMGAGGFGTVIQYLENIEKILGLESKYTYKPDERIARQEAYLIGQRITGYKGTEEDAQEIRKLMSNYRIRMGYDKLDVASRKVVDNQIQAWEEKLNTQIGKHNNKISRFEQNTREFFRVLSAGIETVEKKYNSAIAKIEKPLAAQRGRITATGDYYGSSSVMATYESNRLDDMEKANRGSRLAALRSYRAGLQEQLDKFKNNKLYGTAQSNYDTALANYNAAFQSGDARKIEDTYKILDIASKNLKDFTKQEADLTKKIEDLDIDIAELDYSINGLKDEAKKTRWDKFSTGAGAALSNWKKDRQETIGPGWLTNFGADLTKTGIEELETGFADLFTTVVDGSKKAGDAFKDMARSVLTAMRDIAIQKMATAAVNTMFSFGGMASGGLVLGPEKNRDSVPTMLMPGEFVMKKSAVDTLGADYLNRLNNSNGSVISTSSAFVESAKGNTTSGGSTGTGGVVNVYVVGQQQQQQMTPNDVVVTITNDMLKGGQTKKLVKQIAMGGI